MTIPTDKQTLFGKLFGRESSMNLFNFFKRGGSSAPAARDRLQILLAYERKGEGPSELLFTLREEILAVVGRHVEINPDRVTVQMDRGDKAFDPRGRDRSSKYRPGTVERRQANGRHCARRSDRARRAAPAARLKVLNWCCLRRSFIRQMHEWIGGNGASVESAGNGSSLLPSLAPSPNSNIGAAMTKPLVPFAALGSIHS